MPTGYIIDDKKRQNIIKNDFFINSELKFFKLDKFFFLNDCVCKKYAVSDRKTQSIFDKLKIVA